MTVFGKMDDKGHVTDLREIKLSDIQRCPHTIMVPEHYRTDGSCRCNDPSHTAMKGWGYTWKGGQWR